MIKGSCKTEVSALRKIMDIMRKEPRTEVSPTWNMPARLKFYREQNDKIWQILIKIKSVYL